MKQSHNMFKIIKHSFFWLFTSFALVCASVLLFVLNARLSIEFTGGIEMTLDQLRQVDRVQQSLQDGLVAQGFEKPQVNIEQKDGGLTNVLVALPFQDDAQVKEVSKSINTLLVEQGFIDTADHIVGSSLNGPSVSSYMKSSALNAIVVGLILISVYIMFSFASVRKHISPLTLGGVTILSMFFSILVPAGAYALWMVFDSTITVDTIFIISILTVMGYSINDTIIILDRIRENIAKQHTALENGTVLYGQLIENSIWQTMRRSLGTGITTLLVTLTMFVFGTEVLQKFAFTISIGVLAGTFSSLFFASPLTYLLLNVWKKELKKL